jgi:adenylylsulfate kinase
MSSLNEANNDHGNLAAYPPNAILTNQTGVVIWLTGLSGSGKTTTARVLQDQFRRKGARVELLDGDELRQTISSELGFTKQDRETHATRVAYLGQLLSRNGIITIVALISPFRSFRQHARNLIGKNFVECSLDTGRKRDPTGLYRRAKEGRINDMTGLQAPYETPEHPEVVVNTEKMTPEQCATKIMAYLQDPEVI